MEANSYKDTKFFTWHLLSEWQLDNVLDLLNEKGKTTQAAFSVSSWLGYKSSVMITVV